MNDLIEKYFEGSTSLAEEQQLREYFLSDQVAPEHLPLKAIFALKESKPQEQIDLSLEELIPESKSFSKRLWYSLATTAAVIALVFLLFPKPETTTHLGSFEDPHEALQKTVEALQLVSENINKGTTAISYMQEFDNKTHQVFSLNF